MSCSDELAVVYLEASPPVLCPRVALIDDSPLVIWQRNIYWNCPLFFGGNCGPRQEI